MAPSTSSPSSRSTQFGKCVVCGEETHLKCSDCAKNGIDWMFFCSISHKQLIYFAHKRVCGFNASPFRWPRFSPSEFNTLLRKLPEGPQDLPQGERCDCVDCGGDANIYKDTLLHDYAFTRSTSTSSSKHEVELDSDQVQVLLRLRVQHFGKRIDSTAIWELLQFEPLDLREHFFDALASRFLHLYTIYLALFILANGGLYCFEHQPHLDEYWDHSAKELEQFCKTVVASTNPKEAKIVLKDLDGTKKGISYRDL
ncbi:hypothetical protein JCM5350_007269 [Sporobolomyces pararoseus]